MSYIHPALAEHLRKRWMRPDAYRFAAPGTPEAKPPGYLHPWAEVARAEDKAKAAAEEDAKAAFATKVKILQASQDRLWAMLAEVKYELAWRRLRHKYSPDQPRMPAGNPDGGQWTSGGGGVGISSENGTARREDASGVRQTTQDESRRQDGRVRLAGDPPAPLRRIHPDTTYERDFAAKRSLEYWRGKPTDTIVESLRPGGEESLKTYPDGRIFNGNTRVKILEERGYGVNSLPRDIWRPSSTPFRSRGGGGGGLGGLPTLQ